MVMTLSGSPWSAARVSDPYYKPYHDAWQKWLVKHPDGIITDEKGGMPHTNQIFSAEVLGSLAMKRLLMKMLHPNPDLRITIHDALTSSLIKGTECCAPESCDENGVAIERVTTGDCTLANSKRWSKTILRKHGHIPPKEHKTPDFLRHRFDMGDGYR